jgi:hypothetical protein
MGRNLRGRTHRNERGERYMQFSVRTPWDLGDLVVSISQIEGCTVSEVIRRALVEYVRTAAQSEERPAA